MGVVDGVQNVNNKRSVPREGVVIRHVGIAGGFANNMRLYEPICRI